MNATLPARPADTTRVPWREAVLLLIWLLATIGARPLLLPDEGRYAGVALEMMQGDGLTPLLDGLPFFHKPPLLYWLDMAAMQILGVDAFAVRVGPALLAWMMGMALFLHLRRQHGAALARRGLLVLATAPLFFVGAQYVNHDVGVAACITVAVLCLVRASEAADPSRAGLLVGWAACGLGVLAKGLIGVVLPLAVVLPWLVMSGRWRAALALLNPMGLLVMLTIVAPWMLWMEHQHPGFFDYFIVEQHFRRYAGGTFNNREPIWFFVVVLPLLMLPWSLWLWRARRVRSPQSALHAWWVLVIVGFFSLPASKLVGYVMPALAPAAALLALALPERPRLVRGWAAGAATLCLLIVGVLAWKTPNSHRDIGQALGARLHPGDTVAFADHYFYDVPFYAQLREPAIVLSDWADPEIPQHDNWRKELLDAARFAPDRGRAQLWEWTRQRDLATRACGPQRVWLIANRDMQSRLALPLEPIFGGQHADLWRVACVH